MLDLWFARLSSKQKYVRSLRVCRYRRVQNNNNFQGEGWKSHLTERTFPPTPLHRPARYTALYIIIASFCAQVYIVLPRNECIFTSYAIHNNVIVLNGRRGNVPPSTSAQYKRTVHFFFFNLFIIIISYLAVNFLEVSLPI